MYSSVGYMMCEFNRMLSFAFFISLNTPLIDVLSSRNMKISTKLPFGEIRIHKDLNSKDRVLSAIVS